jgi:hypothetical protein
MVMLALLLLVSWVLLVLASWVRLVVMAVTMGLVVTVVMPRAVCAVTHLLTDSPRRGARVPYDLPNTTCPCTPADTRANHCKGLARNHAHEAIHERMYHNLAQQQRKRPPHVACMSHKAWS